MLKDDIVAFITKISSIGMEAVKISDDQLVVFSAKEVPENVKNDLRSLIPEIKLSFYIGIKPSTRQALSVLLSKEAHKEGISVDNFPLKEEKHHIEIEVPFDIQPIWRDICKILENDGYPTSWVVGGMCYNLQVAKALKMNLKRDRVITQEDCVDVKILVNACKTVEDFINSI